MKYPRTHHLPWSPGATRDDRIQTDLSNLIGKEIIISEKVDGCFPSCTRISMADGTAKKISSINIGDNVLGRDENGNIITTKVTKTFINGTTKKWLKIKGERRGIGRGNNFFSVFCTPNHKIYKPDIDDYIFATYLKPNDMIALHRSDLGLTPIQEQILLGKMLGDGSLRYIDHSADISFSHTESDEEYLKWTQESLGDICSDKISTIISGYGSVMKRSVTINSYFIKEKFYSFIKNKKKIIPNWVADELTPISIAFWYMDDGSLSHSDGQEDRAAFHTCNFTKEDCNILIKGLKKFNINSNIRYPKGYPTICLNADDAEKLFLLVAPYIPQCMQRKLPQRYRGHAGWMPSTENKYKPVLVNQKITSVEEVSIKFNKKYDIETETNNYFANRILVHNSNVMLSSEGVFARSHSGPPTHPSFNALKPLYYSIKDKLSNYDLFGEWCYAKHSIQYSELPAYLLCFGIRYKKDTYPYDNFWMNWHEFVNVCNSLDLYTTPVLYQGVISSEKELEKLVNSLAGQPSACGGIREGVVVRVAEAFPDTVFSTHVCKWVRAGHVQEGDDHWKHKEIIKNILK